MARLLYLTIKDFKNGMSDGVVKKILQQVEVFKRNEFEVDYIYYDGKRKGVYLRSESEEKLLGKKILIKTEDIYMHILRYVKREKYDCVYIRNVHRKDPIFLSVLSRLKKNGTCIVYEIPTYPYDNEAQTLSGKFDLCIDKMFRRFLKRYVDRIVTFMNHNVIWGIPVIPIMNGIIVKQIPMLNQEKKDDKINLVAVSLLRHAQGYERLIRGMAKYVQSGGDKIRIHIVGEGVEKVRYVELVKNEKIEEYITFYGLMKGKELDSMYEMADIALGNFGAYKDDVWVTSPLKMREALAKGLPFVTGGRTDISEKYPTKYVLEMPNDDSDIDMFEIEQYYNSIIEGKSKIQLAQEIRSSTYNIIDMQVTMKPVIDYIQEELQK